ncbi:MAG TPA: hypothetical protein VNT58_07600 [Gaiellaceae bacterium]|nr:hypothetical protein [Gaiellaceae bacterium]
MKHLQIALIASVLALGLAACGGGGGETAATTPDPATVPAGQTTDAGGAATTEVAPAGTDADAQDASCSATESGLTLAKQDLPKPVAALRERLFAAAGECDFDALGAIAQESQGFTYSFGGQEPNGEPAQFWRGLEEGLTGEPAYSLQMILSLPVTRNESGSYVWPSAASPNATDADWQALVDAGFYFPSDIEAMRTGGGYNGWRTAITPAGEWQFFAEGD